MEKELSQSEVQKLIKASEQMRILLLEVLENDEAAAGFNNSNIDEDLKQKIRNALEWKL